MQESEKQRLIKDFVFEKVINAKTDTKQIYLVGYMKDSDPNDKALVKLEKMPFEVKEVEQLKDEKEHVLDEEEYFHNDIYSKHFLHLDQTFNRIQSDLIYPAPESLINKYSFQKVHLVNETVDIYNKFTKPLWVDQVPESQVEWIYNILEKKKEVELRVYENDKFILNLDFAYNKGDMETLYMLAMPIQRDLKSLRDLTTEHLPLLKSIRDESLDAIEKQFPIKRNQILVLLHYLPTYLHLHVNLIIQSYPLFPIYTLRMNLWFYPIIQNQGLFLSINEVSLTNHLQLKLQYMQQIWSIKLEPLLANQYSQMIVYFDVIENIEIDGDYYKKKTMTIRVGENHALFKIFKDNGVINE